MSDKNLFHIGGAAAILGIVLLFVAYAGSTWLGVGALLVAVFCYVMYRYLGSSLLTLAGLIIGVVGTAVMAFSLVVQGQTTGNLSIFSSAGAIFLPPLFFGLAARSSLPRVLASLGIVAGIFGAINAAIVVVGGGNPNAPVNPGLTAWIMGTYYVGLIAALVWFIWVGIYLFREGSGSA